MDPVTPLRHLLVYHNNETNSGSSRHKAPPLIHITDTDIIDGGCRLVMNGGQSSFT
ncbi:unnamed protein product [Brassica rapa]|uniref:Uncharacterized protein n=2 Tax=Brassica TaxID=3705 RepID=A0A8D9HCU5_BRACM|nr:unnamed protein product [Brassica napus]CAG7897135.1 unnamed protein product [Brassica rapa]